MASTTSPPPGTAPPPSTAPAPPAPRQRDALLDNAKFLLIALVVIGHSIEPIRGTPVADAVYMWIYVFHMPAFIIISGFLSRSFDGSSKRVEKLVLTVAVPYLLFWAVHVGIAHLLDLGVPDSPLHPPWTLWFLVALFIWRLSVPVWKRLRWPVTTAVLVSVAAAFAEIGPVLDLGRVLSLLPFFVVGLSLRPEHLDLLKRAWVKAVAALLLVVSAVVAVPASQRLSFDWFFWRDSLPGRDIDPFGPGLLLWIACMASSLVMSVVFLALTPRRATVVTGLGAHTLYIYLGHTLVLRFVEHFGWYDLAFADGAVGVAANLVLGLALTLLFCLPWVRAALRPLVEPHASWLFRAQRKPEAAVAPGDAGHRVADQRADAARP
ncbi:acyltransferase family protein [Actinorugispora endophytica]|uniref:Fucose 4-O-acetylase-like acetyltransferase n=1 Tax=Actinorugispora endophytica TaxID=1605990 RepID=A0A4V3D7J5_9ACTN|nr:acyltransferase family protein [Actinorugispora endophytica]TDQ47997.1 fucose 4-O-acetylase-like acetyltransferase [Actinorugispora endophytica]